jgi:hypothetical protein
MLSSGSCKNPLLVAVTANVPVLLILFTLVVEAIHSSVNSVLISYTVSNPKRHSSASVSVEIQTEHLLNWSLEYYYCTFPLSGMKTVKQYYLIN